MVGDTKFDIIGANQFNMDSAGVLFGYGDRDEMEKEGATYICETVKALSELLYQM